MILPAVKLYNQKRAGLCTKLSGCYFFAQRANCHKASPAKNNASMPVNKKGMLASRFI